MCGTRARGRDRTPKLPAHSHQLLAPLLADCTDPQRKLQLFSAYHKATIRSDARREQRQTRDEGLPGNQTDTQQENQRQNQRRDGIIATTDAEIDEEVAFLLSQSAGGSPLTLDAVNALMQRKEHEHQIEMKYNVNLTNDVQQGHRKSPFRPFTERATWSDAELSLLDAGLGRLPVEHVRNNPGLSQIRRSKLDRDWDGEKKEWVDDTRSGGFADATDHSIHITDLGANGEPWRTPKMSDLARHRAGGSDGQQHLSLMEEVIGHEIGHNVHQQNPALFQKFESVTGWEHLGLSVLLERLMAAAPAGGGLSAAEANAEVDQLESHRQSHYPSRPSIRIAGMDYKIDPYTRDYLAVGPGAISTGRDWDYGRSNPQDHFAEYYTKAIHAPESLYRDLKEEPAAKLATARSQLAALKRRGEEVPAEQLATAEDTVMQAERDEKSRRWQWNLLHEQVFHLGQGDVDAKVAAFTARLPPDKMALSGVFRQRAAMCMTPQQLQNLEAEFHAQLR